MEYFRQDNTEGYTDEQLTELNCRLAVRLIDVDADDADAMQAAAEQLVTEFDSELARNE